MSNIDSGFASSKISFELAKVHQIVTEHSDKQSYTKRTLHIAISQNYILKFV